MLSRHFLRSKVLQAVYAGRCEEEDAIGVAKGFEYHMAKLNELGALQVLLLPYFVKVGSAMLEEGKKKFRPTDEERNPSMKMTSNEFIRRMNDNFELRQFAEKWGACWDTHENLIRESFQDFRHRDEYKRYVSSSQEGFEADKDFAIMLFRYLMNREALRTILGERSLLWEDDFDQIAQYNFMMLKALDETRFNESMPWPVMYDKRIEKDETDMNFARQLLRDTISTRNESEELIRGHLQGWEFERVSRMDILLINMAVAELTGCPSIPEKVTVDEYIELSKEFSSDRSKLFINGILDKLVSELRSRGRIQKSGRGLMDV